MHSKTKILYLGPKNYPPMYGGIEKYVYSLMQKNEEIESFLGVEEIIEPSGNVFLLPQFFSFRQVKTVSNYLKERQINLLHTNKEVFIPLALYFSLFTRRKVVHTFHGLGWRIKEYGLFYRACLLLLDLLACIFIPNIVSVSRRDKRFLQRWVRWRNVHYFPNGVETNEHIGSNNPNKCVYIGRISPVKNVLALVRMFGNDDRTLDIYGLIDNRYPSYADEIKHSIDANEKVNYKGILSKDEILPILSQYNTLYNISFSEGMPTSVLEGASAGLNLVLSDITPHREMNYPDAHYVDPEKPVLTDSFTGISLKNKTHTETFFSMESIRKQNSLYYQHVANDDFRYAKGSK